jgi:asparagine synthase (glutamine-hydrolysing)
LLAAAATGILPDSVRNRGAKGRFVGDHHEGIRKNLKAVIRLSEGRLADRGIVVPRQLQAEIRAAAAGLKIHWGHLKRVLAMEIWLRTIERPSPTEWITSSVLKEAI